VSSGICVLHCRRNFKKVETVLFQKSAFVRGAYQISKPRFLFCGGKGEEEKMLTTVSNNCILKQMMLEKKSSISIEQTPFKNMRTPALKQLIESVLHQPRAARKRPSKEEFIVENPQLEQSVLELVEKSSNITTDQKHVAKAVADHLASLLDEKSTLEEFEGKAIPSISLVDYVDRLIRYVDAWAGEKASVSSTGVSAALMGVEYIDRLNFPISARSIHRLYLCAVLVAVKYTEDFTITNRFWAKVGGIDLQDMNRLECAFCGLLEWKLGVSREEFESQQNRFGEQTF